MRAGFYQPSPGDIYRPRRFADTESVLPITDQYYSSVVSLLGFDAAHGSTTFTDEKGKTWTPAGNASIDTTLPKFGTGCALFDGTGDYLDATSHADFAFGTNAFTVECFARPAASATLYVLTFGPNWTVYLTASGAIFNTAGTNRISGTTVVSTSAYTHLAVTRDATVVRLFVGGALQGTWTDSGPTNIAAAQVYIGRYPTDTGFRFNGRIDEFRITNGVARYTSAFTPPTSAFPRA